MSKSPLSLGTRILAIAATIGCGLLIVLFLGPKVLGATTPHLYAGTVLQQSSAAPALDELHYGDGAPVDLEAFRGDVLLLYFGYTSCPDVCPTALADAARALDAISADERNDVHLLMISVDPSRDDSGVVDEYASFFDESFLGATGEPEAVLKVATQYGIFYEIGEPDDLDHPNDYFVDHTSSLMAIDTDGALRVVWPPSATADEIATDLQELITR